MICRATSNCWFTMSLMPAALACLMTERILVPNMRFALALSSSAASCGHRLHQLDPVLLRCKALVHFQKRHNPFHVPKIVRGRLPLDVPVHGVLEQDGGKNPLAGEAGAGDDARAHLMHDRKHLILVGPGIFLDSVRTQRLGRAATALVQRRNETGMCLHFLQLLFVEAESFHKASFKFSIATNSPDHSGELNGFHCAAMRASPVLPVASFSRIAVS